MKNVCKKRELICTRCTCPADPESRSRLISHPLQDPSTFWGGLAIHKKIAEKCRRPFSDPPGDLPNRPAGGNTGMVEGGLPGQTGAIFHFRPYPRISGEGKGLSSARRRDKQFPSVALCTKQGKVQMPWQQKLKTLDHISAAYSTGVMRAAFNSSSSSALRAATLPHCGGLGCGSRGRGGSR